MLKYAMQSTYVNLTLKIFRSYEIYYLFIYLFIITYGLLLLLIIIYGLLSMVYYMVLLL
jgi:hypothetical protein